MSRWIGALLTGPQNIWATQDKNSDVFKEAFETCDNVILVFSINKSMAFQGYVSPILFSCRESELRAIQGSDGIQARCGSSTFLVEESSLESLWSLLHSLDYNRRDPVQSSRPSEECL